MGMTTGPARGRDDDERLPAQPHKDRPSYLAGVVAPLLHVARVLEDGMQQPGRDRLSWRQVPVEDHVDAFLRHTLRYLDGERVDKDSGLPTMAHVACRALMILWFHK